MSPNEPQVMTKRKCTELISVSPLDHAAIRRIPITALFRSGGRPRRTLGGFRNRQSRGEGHRSQEGVSHHKEAHAFLRRMSRLGGARLAFSRAKNPHPCPKRTDSMVALTSRAGDFGPFRSPPVVTEGFLLAQRLFSGHARFNIRTTLSSVLSSLLLAV